LFSAPRDFLAPLPAVESEKSFSKALPQANSSSPRHICPFQRQPFFFSRRKPFPFVFFFSSFFTAYSRNFFVRVFFLPNPHRLPLQQRGPHFSSFSPFSSIVSNLTFSPVCFSMRVIFPSPSRPCTGLPALSSFPSPSTKFHSFASSAHLILFPLFCTRVDKFPSNCKSLGDVCIPPFHATSTNGPFFFISFL